MFKKNLLAAAVVVISMTGAVSAGTHDALHAAAKMETSVWEATAATFMHEFHYSMHTDHDNRRLALMDIENDIMLFESSMKTLMAEMPGQSAALSRVASMWEEFKADSATIISMTDEGSTNHHHLHMKLWHGAEALNAEIETLITSVIEG